MPFLRVTSGFLAGSVLPKEMKVWQPTRFGGLELSNMEDLNPVAFIGGLQQCIPHFIGTRGLCNLL